MASLITIILYLSILVYVPRIFNASLEYKKSKMQREYTVLFNIALLCLSVVAAFREYTGTDSKMYIDVYDSQYFSRAYGEFGKLFVLLYQTVHVLNLPHQAMFFLISLLQSFFVFKSIEHFQNEIDCKLACYIYIAVMYFQSFNIMRQQLAVAIIIYALVLFLDKHKIISVLLILVAAQIHYTAYIVLVIPVAVFAFESKYRKYIFVGVFSTLLYLVFNRQVLSNIYTFFTDRHTGYLDMQVETDGRWYNYFIKNAIIIIIMFASIKNYQNDRKFYAIFGLTVSGYILCTLEFITNTQVGRIGYYFYQLIIILAAFCAKYELQLLGGKIKIKNTKQIIYVFFTMVFIYDYLIKGFSHLVPYHLTYK